MDVKPTQRFTQMISRQVEALRAWLPTAPQQLRSFVEEARADPSIIFRGTAVRVALIAGGGLLLALIVYAAGQWIAPSTNMGEPAETVPYSVRCTNPHCTWSKQRQTIELDREFDDWPTECPTCKKDTLYPFARCHNTKCRKWVVPRIMDDGSWRCPKCGAKM
jgi:hypothetical protein